MWCSNDHFTHGKVAERNRQNPTSIFGSKLDCEPIFACVPAQRRCPSYCSGYLHIWLRRYAKPRRSADPLAGLQLPSWHEQLRERRASNVARPAELCEARKLQAAPRAAARLVDVARLRTRDRSDVGATERHTLSTPSLTTRATAGHTGRAWRSSPSASRSRPWRPASSRRPRRPRARRSRPTAPLSATTASRRRSATSTPWGSRRRSTTRPCCGSEPPRSSTAAWPWPPSRAAS